VEAGLRKSLSACVLVFGKQCEPDLVRQSDLACVNQVNAPEFGSQNRPVKKHWNERKDKGKMHSVCKRAALQKGLLQLKSAIKEDSSLQILSHALLRASGGRLQLAATNLSIAISCEVDALILEEGAVAVPWHRLEHLASHLPPLPAAAKGGRKDVEQLVEMKMEADTSTLTVRSGSSRATIYGMHESEFPESLVVEQVGEGEIACVSLDAALFASAVTKVAFAAATDEQWIEHSGQDVLRGILLRVEGSALVLVARDGHRLALCEVPLLTESQREGAGVVVAGVVSEFARLLASRKSHVPVQIALDEERGQMGCTLPGFILSSRLLRGTYPMGFRDHFTHGYRVRAVVGTRALAAALKSVAQVAGENGDLVVFRYEPGGADGIGSVSVTAQAQGLGEQTEVVELLDLEGGDTQFQLVLKVPQLAGIVAAIDTPGVALEVRAQSAPVVIRPVEDESGVRCAYVLVPCVVNT
jgi:DNA polymerase III subunit beta